MKHLSKGIAFTIVALLFFILVVYLDSRHSRSLDLNVLLYIVSMVFFALALFFYFRDYKFLYGKVLFLATSLILSIMFFHLITFRANAVKSEKAAFDRMENAKKVFLESHGFRP